MRLFFRVIICGVFLGLLQGCATGLSSKDTEVFQGSYLTGNYQQAADVVESGLGLFDSKTQTRAPVVPTETNAVLLHLDAAENLRMAKSINRAVEHYDAAEVLFRQKDTESFGSSLLGAYEPTPAEKILVNFYKALSFWSQGDYGNARVEFNRANERTRLAVERYSAEVKAAQDEANKAKRENNIDSIDFSSFAAKPEISSEVNQWEVYDSFVNPTVAFTNALFLASQDGPASNDARVFMSRVHEMVGRGSEDNPAFDYSDVGEDTIWVLAETGLGPVLGQRKVNLPVPYKGDTLILSMAFPRFKERPNSVSLNRYALNGRQLRFSELATMDKLVKTELSKRWPAIVTTEVVSAFVMMFLQREAGKENKYLGFAAKLLTVAANEADTRIWTLTPQKWSVAKIRRPDNPVLTINYGAEVMEVPIEPRSAIVYIKQPTGQARPFVEVLPLGEASAL